MAESKNKQKFSKEELHQENLKLKQEVREKRDLNHEDQQRIVETLSMRNMAVYALCVFLPPIGIPYMWKNQTKLHLRNSSVYLWIFVGTVCLLGYLKLIAETLGWL